MQSRCESRQITREQNRRSRIEAGQNMLSWSGSESLVPKLQWLSAAHLRRVEGRVMTARYLVSSHSASNDQMRLSPRCTA